GTADGDGLIPAPPLGLRVNSTLQLSTQTFVDAYDSNFGPYGAGGNFGADGLVGTNSTAASAIFVSSSAYIRGDALVGPGGDPNTVIESYGSITGEQAAATVPYRMPDLDLPQNFPVGTLQPYQTVIDIAVDTTLTGDFDLSDNLDVAPMWCGTLDVDQTATLTVQGHLQIRVDNMARIDGAINVLPDSSLTIWAAGDVYADTNSTQINAVTGRSTDVIINAVGPGDLIFKNGIVCATVLAPERELLVTQDGQFCGSFVGESMMVAGQSEIHIDLATGRQTYQNFALVVEDRIVLKNCTVDGFDSTSGPYGGPNIHNQATIVSNAMGTDRINIMDGSVIDADVRCGVGNDPSTAVAISADSTVTGDIAALSSPVAVPLVTPDPVAPTQGKVVWNNDLTVSSDIECTDLTISEAIVSIDGDVTFRVDGRMLLDDAEIRILPGSRLTLLIKTRLKLTGISEVNMNTGDPSRVWIPRMGYTGGGLVSLTGTSKLSAWIQGTKTVFEGTPGSEFFGSFAGKDFLASGMTIHIDAPRTAASCVTIADTNGLAGVPATGAINSAATFDEWFKDVLGVNMTTVLPITMTRDINGVYEHLNSGFYPIDGQLLGNEGTARNDFFTYAIEADFAYDECLGQFIEFQGGDGVWMFINNQLVVDLGGVTPFDPQIIELDRLGLTDGQTYTMHLFYAHRNSFSAVFRLRTNLVMYSKNVPAITAVFD
ncbi:MAG: fibro-slime domain-containing protein, partial [Planctomycetota bacterium]